MSATVHQFGEHRISRRPLRALSVGPEAAECALLAERAAALLGVTEKAVVARGRYRPGMAALAAQLGALSAAIDALCSRQLAVGALWDDGYACGCAWVTGRTP